MVEPPRHQTRQVREPPVVEPLGSRRRNSRLRKRVGHPSAPAIQARRPSKRAGHPSAIRKANGRGRKSGPRTKGSVLKFWVPSLGVAAAETKSRKVPKSAEKCLEPFDLAPFVFCPVPLTSHHQPSSDGRHSCSVAHPATNAGLHRSTGDSVPGLIRRRPPAGSNA
jgi:hypothetical protein